MDTGELVRTPPAVSVKRLSARIRSEYLEMPGLRLTLQQAQRLFGLDPLVCLNVFEALTRDKFLSQSHDGQFRSVERT